jgi:HEPN domain-containing protein
MTTPDIIKHWANGARSAMKMARMARDAGEYEHALFNCHLAVEKAMKTVYLEEKGTEHPRTHDLERLSHELSIVLSADQYDWLADLTEFVIDARYADPVWAIEQATQENADRWINRTETLLSSLLP